MLWFPDVLGCTLSDGHSEERTRVTALFAEAKTNLEQAANLAPEDKDIQKPTLIVVSATKTQKNGSSCVFACCLAQTMITAQKALRAAY